MSARREEGGCIKKLGRYCILLAVTLSSNSKTIDADVGSPVTLSKIVYCVLL